MTCSIVTACMNRNSGLLQGLKSWLKLNVEEIVIVDWSSEHEVKETLASHNIVDPRIKIIRVEAEKYWNLTRAFNLGFKHISSETVIKVDAEVTISEDFLAQHILQAGVYYRGDWLKVESENQIYVNGFFYTYTKYLQAVNGFNEYIDLYGYDDLDIYQRLEGGSLNLKPREVTGQYIFHIEHDDRDRVVNSEKNPNYALLPNVLKSIPGFLVLFNELLVKNMPSWGPHSANAVYQMQCVVHNYYVANVKQIFTHSHHEKSKRDAAYYAVLKYVSWFVSPNIYNLAYSDVVDYLNKNEKNLSWDKMRLELNLEEPLASVVDCESC